MQATRAISRRDSIWASTVTSERPHGPAGSRASDAPTGPAYPQPRVRKASERPSKASAVASLTHGPR